jgi:alpha-tubulin suppressor-like RCC1 family protein
MAPQCAAIASTIRQMRGLRACAAAAAIFGGACLVDTSGLTGGDAGAADATAAGDATGGSDAAAAGDASDAQGDTTIGASDASDSAIPIDAPDGPPPIPAIAIAAGGDTTCAIAENHDVYCWGRDDDDQLGDHTGQDRVFPAPVPGLPAGSYIELAASTTYACADDQRTPPRCWGKAPTPAPTMAVSSLAAGATHACGVDAMGDVFCWGANDQGQRGSGGIGDNGASMVTGLPGSAYYLAAGQAHTCALTGTNGGKGALYCWGANDSGQIGDGSTTMRPSAVRILNLFTSFTGIVSAGLHHTCINDTGTYKCWGNNASGQIGDGTVVDRYVPTQVAIALNGGALGATHTCAFTNASNFSCWGDNTYGQVGDGTMVQRLMQTEVDIPGYDTAPPAVHQMVAGRAHTCVLFETGDIWCWGANDHGQLGDGTKLTRSVPTRTLPLR